MDNHNKSLNVWAQRKDGVIRGIRVRRNGEIADTVMYSMTVEEWADVKSNLLQKLKNYEQ